ncbi:hypothetical protein LXL04_005242 [Taraxacum kok-saghyz]
MRFLYSKVATNQKYNIPIHESPSNLVSNLANKGTIISYNSLLNCTYTKYMASRVEPQGHGTGAYTSLRKGTVWNTSNVMAEGASSADMDVEDVGQCMIVDLHYNGMFAPKPFAYLNDEGIRRIDNEAYYSDFHVSGYDNPPDFRVDLYIDHHREPVLDWAESDAPVDEDSDLQWVEDDDDDDKDSQKSYEALVEHEVDEEVPTFNKTIGDVFLSKLCAKVPDYANNDDEENYEPD